MNQRARLRLRSSARHWRCRSRSSVTTVATSCSNEIIAIVRETHGNDGAPVACGNGCQGDDRHPAHRPLLDELTLSVFWNGNVLALGHTHAFWLLARLTRSANQYVTRVDLIQEVWDDVFT